MIILSYVGRIVRVCNTESMEFLKISSDMAHVVAGALNGALSQHKSVIWLVPGGSNIPLVVDTMALIDEALSRNLIIMQTDERYGTLQSPDCNWRQLLQAGFNPKHAQVYPILVNDEETLAEVSLRYNQTLQEQFDTADYRIGQFGIGTDGHTAGIKPDTAATRSRQLVAGYEAEDFSRITMTFAAIQKLHAAYCFAFGANKQLVVEQLKENSTPIETFPAGVLTAVPVSKIYSGNADT